MKLLIISDASLNPTDATPAFARAIARELAKSGHETHLLELVASEEHAHADACGVREHSLYCADEKELHALVRAAKGKGALSLALRLLARPKAALAAFRLVALGNGPAQAALQRETERLVKQYNVDAAVAFAAPHQAVFALKNARIPAAKYAVMFDPYSTLPLYAAPKYRKREARLYEEMRHVFITREMRAQLEKTPLARYISKMTELPFPAVVRPVEAPRPDFLDAKYTNLVFVGNLYPKLRSPEFFLQIFSKLNSPALRFVMVGGGREQFPAGYFERWGELLGERFLMTGGVPRDVAFAAMRHADFLVNIGNSAREQLPSKVFDYMCAGRPIINAEHCADDPARAYFAKYPECLTLSASEGVTPEALERAESFIAKSAERSVPFEQVEQAFFENTPKAAAGVLTEHIEGNN